MSEVIVGIDLGTTKVASAIGVLGHGKELEILGRGMENCSDIKKGVIINVEAVGGAIHASIKKAEISANMPVKSAFVNISSAHVQIVLNSATVEISDKVSGVRRGDIEKAIEAVANIEISEQMQVIDIIAKKYSIDEHEGIQEPIGMKGNLLKVDADIVLGKTIVVDSLMRAMEEADIKINGFCVSSLVAGESILTNEERDFGVILIDVGGTSTEISIFKDGELVFSDYIAIGGDNITKDISIGLKVPFYEAEKLKREYELCLTSLFGDDQKIGIFDISGGKREISVSELADIIEARAGEIVKLSFEVLRNSGVKRSQLSGVVLTGGGISYIDGCKDFTENIFEIPVRIPGYKGIGGGNPEYYGAVGILHYVVSIAKFSGRNKTQEAEELPKKVKLGLIDRVKSIFVSMVNS